MLPKLEGFATAVLGRLDATSLARVTADLESIDSTIQSRPDLSAVLTDTSISHVARGQVVNDLLENKVSAEALRLAVYAATAVPAQEVPRSLGDLVLWRPCSS